MRVLILMGSPRLGGNTAELCKPFIDEFKLSGAETEYITLHDKNISPCLGCYRCQGVAGEYGCVQNDDMQDVVRSILKADVLVFATPVYIWQSTPEIKAVMDRMYGLNKFYGSAPREVLNKGQSYALLTTCGYEFEYGADLLGEGIRRWCVHSGLNYLGMYAVRDEDDLASFKTEAAVNGARVFARKIIGASAPVIRRYKILTDFSRVYRFLQETYDPVTLNSMLLPQYFEYAHTHPYFDYFNTHRFGIMEDGGEIVGIACYEMKPGSCCHLHTDKHHSHLLPELLNWAERELSVKTESGERSLEFWVTDKEPDKIELLKSNGYTLASSEPINIFRYNKPFPERALPDGFRFIDGTEADYKKLHDCFWKGFDHDDNPDDDFEGNIFSCNSPHSDISLMTIVVAPDGEYSCALGMWYDEHNRYAYLEPLATVPKYRRMGLATAALSEAMKKRKCWAQNIASAARASFIWLSALKRCAIGNFGRRNGKPALILSAVSL